MKCAGMRHKWSPPEILASDARGHGETEVPLQSTESMDWLNYHHLLYFWVTAREGSITRASQRLDLAQPTVSGQIQALEKRIGEQLFLRQGRKLTLTETGRMVFGYAEQIFTIGQELYDALQNQAPEGPPVVNIGISDALPKLAVCKLVEILLKDGGPKQRLTCREGKTEDLLHSLESFELDLVLSDSPMPSARNGNGSSARAFNHLLGESKLVLFGNDELVGRHGGSAEKLDGAPMLLPTENTVARRELDAWFDRAGVTPHLVAEFEDSAMLKTFGERGYGLFPAPEFVAEDVCDRYSVKPALVLDDAREQLYGITVERKIRNPAVQSVIDGARARLAQHSGAGSDSASGSSVSASTAE
ncbi:MAG: LysR family transcriptional regulator [Planctomycetota bacterium]